MLTTYATHGGFGIPSVDPPLIYGFLMADRHMRREAASIFYGENVFQFLSMQAVIPFLQDQSPMTLQSLKHLKIVFCLVEADFDGKLRPDHVMGGDRYGQRPYCAEPKDITRLCVDLGRFDKLHLRTLSIRLKDYLDDFLIMPWTYLDEKGIYNNTYREVRDWFDEVENDGGWAWEICRSINDLDALGITYRDFHPIDEALSRNIIFSDEDYVDKLDQHSQHCSGIERAYWEFLAPRMLKRLDDRHDPDSLQHRNISHQYTED